MDAGEKGRRVARSLSNARLIYMALLASLVIYGGIAFMVAGGAGTPSAKSGEPVATALPAASQHLMLIVFAVVSAVVTIGGIPLLRHLLLPARRPPAGTGARSELGVALGRLLSAHVGTWALAESIAVYGLILAFLSYQPLYYIGFAVLAAANFALYPPRADLWSEVAAASEG
jgi:hypothetical protein